MTSTDYRVNSDGRIFQEIAQRAPGASWLLSRAAGGIGAMVATFGNHIAPESLKLMLLAYGIDHAYRVLSLDEIAHSIPHVRKDEVREVLEFLAQEGLVTRFSGRYCFNKAIPVELRQEIERLITPSGTIRQKRN